MADKLERNETPLLQMIDLFHGLIQVPGIGHVKITASRRVHGVGNLLGRSRLQGDTDKIDAAAFLSARFHFLERIAAVVVISIAKEDDDLSFGAASLLPREPVEIIGHAETL